MYTIEENEVNEETIKNINITVVGDAATGKTSLIISYKEEKFIDDYSPTVLDTYLMDLEINNEPYKVILNDTVGHESYDGIRNLQYTGTDVFVICYAIDSIDSYENVWTKWYPELNRFNPKSLKILVATKTDLRNGALDNASFLDSKKGLKMRKQIKAAQFVECSAKERHNVDEVFEKAILAAIKSRETKSTMKRVKEICVLL